MAVFLRLKLLRQKAGMTQTEVAKLLGVSREAYSMYESGKRQPGFEALDILAEQYQVSLDYLLGRSECPHMAEALDESEKMFLEQYRALDARGRRTLHALAAIELQNKERPE